MSRILTLGWLACLAGALWIAALTPLASGYELSLIDAYPPIFWALTIAASACSATILLTLADRETKSGWWASGVLGIMATNAFVLSLPIFRGYAVSDRADALNHIGYARDILNTGTVSQLDFYPGMHFLQVALQTMGGASEGEAFVMINVAFSLLWTLGLVMLVQQLAGDVRAAYLAAALSAPFVLLVYHTLALPSTLSAMLLPILFALHLRRAATHGWDRAATILAEILLAFLLVYFHPMTTLYAIALLLAFEVGTRLRTTLRQRSFRVAPAQGTFQQTLGMVAILGITFFTWAFSSSVVAKSYSSVVRWLMGESDRNSALGEAVGLIQIAHLPPMELARILTNSFGLPLLVLSLAGVAIMVLVVRSARGKRLPPNRHFVFVFAFMSALIVTVGMFLISSSERHPIRLVRILIILGLCCLAWWSWEAIFKRADALFWAKPSARRRQLLVGMVSVLLFASIGLGQLNVYAHPRNGQPNQQVTASELSGMDWLIQHRIADSGQASILPDYLVRFEAYFLGYEGMHSLPHWWEKETWLPTHFYKPEWTCMSDIAPGTTTYLALSDDGRISPLRFPAEVRDLAHVYTPADWQALAADASVSKLYDDGGFEVWVTNGEARCQ
jgi:hypothetical protein